MTIRIVRLFLESESEKGFARMQEPVHPLDARIILFILGDADLRAAIITK